MCLHIMINHITETKRCLALVNLGVSSYHLFVSCHVVETKKKPNVLFLVFFSYLFFFCLRNRHTTNQATETVEVNRH
jgi:hypothetical protein